MSGSDSSFLGNVADLQRMIRKNKTTLGVEVRQESKVTVTEHRAPTDESVRLLDEMQQKAEDRLVCMLSCQATPFSFTAHCFHDYSDPFFERLRIRFALGEVPHDITINIPMSSTRTRSEYVIAIRDAIAKEIANVILQGSYQELVKFHSFR